jgi:hypothetical protein
MAAKHRRSRWRVKIATQVVVLAIDPVLESTELPA